MYEFPLFTIRIRDRCKQKTKLCDRYTRSRAQLNCIVNKRAGAIVGIGCRLQ